MPTHDVKLHKSFLESWGRLSPTARDQVLVILRELEGDALYTPDSEDYLVAFDNEDSSSVGVVTQNVKAWRGWQLIWIVEYADLHPVRVKIRLRNEATIRSEDL